MSLPRFYIQDLVGPLIELTGDEARHASGARRLRVGDQTEVFDGRGRSAITVIREISSRKVFMECAEVRDEALAQNLPEVAVAVPKGKRLQIMIEKLTECGIGSIQPLKFERSVCEGGEPETKWSRWSIEACKQCRRNWLPEIKPALKISDYLRNFSGELYLADIQGDKPVFSPGKKSCCIIGPEGGLTEQEYAYCAAAGAKYLRFGQHILRTETAAIAFAVMACP